MRAQWIASHNQARAPPSLWRFMLVRMNVLRYAQDGSINVNGLLTMGIAMIFIAVGFIIYPIAVTGTDAILAYSYSGTGSITDANFTGLTSVVGVVPLIVLLGFVSASVVTGFLGYRSMKGGQSVSLAPTNLMMLGIGMIFIAVGLIIFPVVLDGASSAWQTSSVAAGTYTGLIPILKVAPLIVLTGFISAGIVTGFFGISKMAKGG